MTYKLSPYCCVIRLRDNAVIPLDESNDDYQTYKKWLADGGIPEPADSSDS